MDRTLWVWHVRRLYRWLADARRSLAYRGLGGGLRHALSRKPVTTGGQAAAAPLPITPPQTGRTILLVDEVMPDPTRDSGSCRQVAVIELLKSLGWQVTFMPHSGRATPSEQALLTSMGVSLIGIRGKPSLARWLDVAQPDAALLCRYHVARAHMPLVRQAAPNALILLDTIDLHFLRLQREAEVLGLGDSVHQRIAKVRKHELDTIRSSDIAFVISQDEQQRLLELLPGIDARVLSNIHSAEGDTPDHAARTGFLFVGGMAHTPNLDAVRWLGREIAPLIGAALPDARIHVVGFISDEIRAELSAYPLEIHGQVPDLTPYLHGCRVSLAPLRYGAGVKGKVNSAMSHGMPVVATPIAAEGMSLCDGEDVLIAEDAKSFAEAAIKLHQDRELWNRLSEGGKRNIALHFSPELARHALRDALPHSAI